MTEDQTNWQLRHVKNLQNAKERAEARGAIRYAKRIQIKLDATEEYSPLSKEQLFQELERLETEMDQYEASNTEIPDDIEARFDIICTLWGPFPPKETKTS